MIERWKVEDAEKWRERIADIPWIKFPPEWHVKVIPPFGGAQARFLVSLDGEKQNVSVYLDFDCALGYYTRNGEEAPYWEVYPYQGDVGRCDIGDTAELLRMISESLSETLPPTTESPQQP